MSDSAKYSISSKGSLVSGFDSEQVTASFCELFNVSVEKASVYINKQKLIKKNLSEKDVQAFRTCLENIGMAVIVQSQESATDSQLVAQARTSKDVLSLIPTGDESDNVSSEAPEKPKGFSCPRCELEQEESEECIGCGVIFKKFNAAATTVSNDSLRERKTQVTAESSTRARPAATREDSLDSINVQMIAIPMAVMIACAFLWKLIALGIDRELAVIAWAIGGAIGAAAVAGGARGRAAAVACALLVVVSIFGGKYMYMSSYQQDFAAVFDDQSSTEMQSFIEVINEEAEVFAQTPRDDASIKQFMFDYEYTEARNPVFVTDEELAEFREYLQPMLESGVDSSMSSAEFLQNASPELGAAMNESVWSWVFESLGLIDMLFLFLGCGTAFRLVSEAD